MPAASVNCTAALPARQIERLCAQGYELNPEEWIPYELLADTVALEAWETRQREIIEAWEADGAMAGAEP